MYIGEYNLREQQQKTLNPQHKQPILSSKINELLTIARTHTETHKHSTKHLNTKKRAPT